MNTKVATSLLREEAFDSVLQARLSEVNRTEEDATMLRHLVDRFRDARPVVRERFLAIINEAQAAGEDSQPLAGEQNV
jgi:hypothetical protein